MPNATSQEALNQKSRQGQGGYTKTKGYSNKHAHETRTLRELIYDAWARIPGAYNVELIDLFGRLNFSQISNSEIDPNGHLSAAKVICQNTNQILELAKYRSGDFASHLITIGYSQVSIEIDYDCWLTYNPKSKRYVVNQVINNRTRQFSCQNVEDSFYEACEMTSNPPTVIKLPSRNPKVKAYSLRPMLKANM